MNRDALRAARNILTGGGATNARGVARARRASGRARGFTYG